MAFVYFSFGITVAAIAPMLTVVREDLGASRGEMGFALGAWALIYIVTAPIAGRFIDRFDLGWSIALGGVSVAGSLLLRAAAQGVGTLWLAVAFFGVFGPLISASAPTLVATWFPDEADRRRAVGFYAMAPAIGGTLTVAVTNPILLEWFDSWREVLVFEASIAVVATVVWVGVWRWLDKPPRPERPTTAEKGSLRHLLGSAEVRLILVMAFAVFFLTHGLGTWLPTVLEEFGEMSPTAAGNWVGVAGILAIAASGTVPAATRADRIHLTIATLMAVSALALFGMAIGPTWAFGPLAIVLALRSAVIPLAIVSLLESDRVTPAVAGFANGVWFSVAEVGGVTGPLSVGAIADTDAGYAAAMTTVGVVAVGATGVAIATHRVASRTAVGR